MDRKLNIVFIFIAVFCGKLLMVNTNLISVFSDGESVVLINPYCKKKNAKNTDGQQMDASPVKSMLSIDYNCQNPMQLQNFKSVDKPAFNIIKRFSYLKTEFSSIVPGKPSPPPKLNRLIA